MKTYPRVAVSLRFVIVMLVSGCASAMRFSPTEAPAAAEERTFERQAVAPTPMPTAMPATTPMPAGAGGHTLPAVALRANRLIIKNADLQLTVEETDVAIDRVTQVVGDVGGYIVSSRVWYQDWLGKAYKYASLTIGIPVDEFESAMRWLRDLALTVDDERAGGQDVTDEYVDLESRLRNLRATRDRIREFLDQAQNVEEALRVNEELKVVEAEIEAVQGRMNYLFDRAAYSTITVQLSPALPDPPADPTPTPTPTLAPWSASQVAQDAGKTFTAILQAFIEIAIWFGIVVLPFVLPPAALLLVIRYLLKRKQV